MRIALASIDQDLIEQISELARGCGCSLELLDSARALADAECEIRLIECAGLNLAARSVAGVAFSADDWLLLLRGSAASEQVGAGPDGARALQIIVAPNERRGDLLERLEEALPRRAWGTSDAAERLLGNTPGMLQVKQQVRRVARFQDVSVIVIGESGSGRELVAEAIHKLASGDRDPFLAINCAAIPEQLFEVELFGSEATLGAAPRPARTGLLEAARAGTVFLDEVGAMPLLLQSKLLRALETREFCRVGSDVRVPLRARVISAADPVSASASGTIHADLRFRLAGFTIAIPPLRERLDDVEQLAKHFIARFGMRQGVSNCSISSEALLELRRGEWPGNVRQLRKALEHAVILSAGGAVQVQDVLAAREQLKNLTAPAHEAEAGHEDVGVGLDGQLSGARVRGLFAEGGLRDIERDLILAAFRESDGNLSQTSRLLGMPRTTLRAKLRRFGAL